MGKWMETDERQQNRGEGLGAPVTEEGLIEACKREIQ